METKIKDEVDKFFSDVEEIIFPDRKPGSEDLKDVPVIGLLLKKNKFHEYLNSGINKKIKSLLGDKQPKLLITGESNINSVILSIVDDKNNLEFKIQNAFLHDSFKNFASLTEENDKIFLLLASEEDKEIKFDQEKNKTLLLILDGYSVVYN